MGQPDEGMTTGAAANWLRNNGLPVTGRTVTRWCAHGAIVALRTPGQRGQFRVRLSALRALLLANGLDAEAA